MTMCVNITSFVLVLIFLAIIFNTFWNVVDKIKPFTYRKVPLSELSDHISDIFNRGMDRSQMHIKCEQNGMIIVFQKNYKIRTTGIKFYLLTIISSIKDENVLGMIKTLEDQGLILPRALYSEPFHSAA